jgi:hypothetical protein
MFWLKLVKDFVKILREGQTPTQIAGGFALGSITILAFPSCPREQLRQARGREL